jgi:maltooligosyltrehalose trehalohydrolase
MIFMGQEWATSSPFVFFSNHEGAFGTQISESRRKEFKLFGANWPAETLRAMPDPEALESFWQSKLNWNEHQSGEHLKILRLYRECLDLRKSDSHFQRTERDQWNVSARDGRVFVRYGISSAPYKVLVVQLAEKVLPPDLLATELQAGRLILSSNELRFGGKRPAANSESTGLVAFTGPEAVLLEVSSLPSHF